MKALPALLSLAGAALALHLFAWPQDAIGQATPEIFRDADISLGEQMIVEHGCAECHARKVGGDGSAIYQPTGRINTPGFLRGMVELCNTQLNLGMFPEEVTAVAAVLNRDYYKFR